MSNEFKDRYLRVVVFAAGLFVMGYTFLYGESRFMEPRAIPVIVLALGLGLTILLWKRGK